MVFEEQAWMNDWNEQSKRKALLILIQGETSYWKYGLRIDQKATTYQKLKKELIKTFCPSTYKQDLLRKFQGLLWKPREQTLKTSFHIGDSGTCDST